MHKNRDQGAKLLFAAELLCPREAGKKDSSNVVVENQQVE